MQVLIIGGGTAGWIAALTVRRAIPSASVTLVQSTEIGILGAGEGTTPHFIWEFLDFVGIPVSALVQNVGATLKTGIEFINWTGDGGSYYHPFFDSRTTIHDVTLYPPDMSVPDDLLNFSARAARQGRVPFRPRESPPPGDPIRRYDQLGTFAVHFDAVRLARYLEQVGRERGITIIDSRLQDLRRTPSGDIDRVRLENGQILPCDLIFDCTGFHRAILGKVLKVPWIDVTPTLPCDRAVPFFLPIKPPIPPVTQSIAMDCGWAWKIPTQARYGCGYVFDSRFATDEQAVAEVKRRFGPEAEVPRVFKFQAGYFQDVWVNNVFGVGLATGFLEPLEATSIWVSVLTLSEFLKYYFPQADDRARRDFGQFYRSLMSRVVDFLYLHYLTPRQDTPFWATFRERTRTPDFVREVVDEGGMRWMFNEHPQNAGHPAPFPATAWMHVAYGLRLLNREAMERHWRHFNFSEGYRERLARHVDRLDQELSSCVDHDTLLSVLRRPAAQGAEVLASIA